MASEQGGTMYTVSSPERYGEQAAAVLVDTLDFIEAPGYGPSRNWIADTLKALNVGESITRIDGLDRKTIITRVA